jgi:hypothetical protein
MSDPVKCRGCSDVRATSCGAEDCPIPLQMSGELDTPPEMPAAEVAEILAVLNAIGVEHPASLVGEGWDDVFAGEVTWTLCGWTVVVFNDCGGWDYIDHIVAPDGRRWDYDAMADLVKFWRPSSANGWPSLEPKDLR